MSERRTTARHLTRLWGVFFLTLASVWPALGAASVPLTPALWEVKDETGTRMYLFGSIHFGEPSMYPLPAAVLSAFEASDALVVEFDLRRLDPVTAAKAIATHGTLPAGESLASRIGAPLMQRLETLGSQYGIPMALVQSFREWLVATVLTQAAMAKLGLDEGNGIDLHFLKASEGKTVISLESIDSQLSLFSELSDTDAVLFLEDTVAELEKGSGYLDSLLKAWRTGDVAGLEKFVGEKIRDVSPNVYRALIEDRNVNMVQGVAKRARAHPRETQFVVVGAGHMTGPTGLVAALRTEGFTVTRVRY